MKPVSTFEVLEPRITPASVSITYTDGDGDLVKITARISGDAAPLDASDLVFTDGDPDGQLSVLKLTEPGFTGASISFKITRKAGGDGQAHVGFIDATGVDLDKVIVKGDLGKIAAGDGTTTNDPGLNLLKARSMGTLGLITQGGLGDLESNIFGKLGALKIENDFANASIKSMASIIEDSEIGSVFIGGDFIGGDELLSGYIYSFGSMGQVRVRGDVKGGIGNFSGQIGSADGMGNVRIGGSIIGGPGLQSGSIITNEAMGDVRVGGDLIGGAGPQSGRIASEGAMGDVEVRRDVIGSGGNFSGEISSGKSIDSVRIGGSIIGSAGFRSAQIYAVLTIDDIRIGGDILGGGSASGALSASGGMGNVRIGGSLVAGIGGSSGLIFSGKSMGNVRIAGDIVGGSADDIFDASVTDAGGILSYGRIESVTIGGSLVAGSNGGTGTLTRCGAIVAKHDIGPIKIKGSIQGNSTNPVVILAEGQEEKPASGVDLGITSISVGGDVGFARILSGFDLDQMPVNADASIGTVTVGRKWICSSLVAGAQDSGADGFGINDSLQTVRNTALIAQIAKIQIKGDVVGTLGTGDNYGFVSQQIGQLKISSRDVPLLAGANNDNLLFIRTNDLRLLEVE